MITRWKLSNFKSFKRGVDIELKPLTILSGSNSSGKSTLIQSILLINQTLSSKIGSRSVVLNGKLVKLGQFNDIVSFGSKSKKINVGWELESGEFSRSSRYYPASFALKKRPLTKIGCDISFDVSQSSQTNELLQLRPKLYFCAFYGLFLEDESHIQRQEIIIRRRASKRKDRTSTNSDQQHEFSIKLDPESSSQIKDIIPTANVLDCELSHFLPDRLLIQFNYAAELARRIEGIVQRGRYRPAVDTRLFPYSASIPTRILREVFVKYFGKFGRRVIEQLPPRSRETTLSDLERAIRRVQPTARGKQREEFETLNQLDTTTGLAAAIELSLNELDGFGSENDYVSVPLGFALPSFEYSLSYTKEFFSERVRYLGPLRDEPRSAYPIITEEDPFDVGTKGQYTAAILHFYGEESVEYCSPPCDDSSLPSSLSDWPVMNKPLKTAIIDWLKYLEIADKVETQDFAEYGHKLQVTTSGTRKLQDLTHVGVGVSQVIPILVMCLWAEKGTTLIIEQPELHLHPRVQARLADFFLSITRLNKQCIIETHSEHLINRIRMRIAASEPGTQPEKVLKIYFAEKRHGETFLEDIATNEFGVIQNWPKGFFDQAQYEAEDILRAVLQKKKAVRNGKPTDE